MTEESPPKEMVVHLPQLANGHRMETGPLQFGADWPGVFIRGDEALSYADMLQHIGSMLPPEYWAASSMLKALHSILRSCWAGQTGWPPPTSPP